MGSLERAEAVATWFGPEVRPLFGWVHLPANRRVPAGVVLCPPLGVERNLAHYAYRRLAESLAERGLFALRFDYDGTGDSAGSDADPGRLAAWRASITHAIGYCRTAGCPSVALVGMRVGALLAAEAAVGVQVDQLVLWDPCSSGRRFLRQQRAVALLGTGSGPAVASDPASAVDPAVAVDPATGARTAAATGRRLATGLVDLPGWWLRADAAEELSVLEPPARAAERPGGVRRVLVLTRPGASPVRALTAAFPDAVMEQAVAEGQETLLDVNPLDQIVPEAPIARIAHWLAHGVTSPPTTLDNLPVRRRAQITVQGRPVREEIVTLGPDNLFGIVTAGSPEPTFPEVSVGVPWTLFLSSGRDPHVGPNRLWVDLGRAWALDGLPSVRFDAGGLGDSPTRADQPLGLLRAPETFADVENVARSVAPADPSNVLLVGLCSGGYQALDSALSWSAGDGPRGVYAINPFLRFAPPELATGPMYRRRQACRPAHPGSQSARRLHAGRVRYGLWWALWCLRHPGIVRRPRGLARLTDRGTDVLCICGEPEAAEARRALGPPSSGDPHADRRITTIAGLDHALLPGKDRRLATALLTAHVRRRFVRHVPGGATPAPAGGRTAVAMPQSPVEDTVEEPSCRVG